MGLTWGDVGSTVAKAAPLLGSVVGGPAGAIAGAAGTLIASALGCEGNPDAVSATMAGNPEAAVKLREIEAAERARLLDWQTEQLKAELENLKDVRAREVALAQAGSKVAASVPPAAVSILVVIAFGYMLSVVLDKGGEVSPAATLLLGSLSAAFGAVVNYYLGSSLGSTQKTAMLGQAKGA